MPKRKQAFWWVGEEPPEDDEVEEVGNRLDRDEHREQMEDLKDLTNRLAALSPKVRRTMPLDEETLDQLDLLAAAAHRPDRRRVLLKARQMVALADPEKLEAALAGNTPANQWDREMVHWRNRIVAGDDRVIQEFVQTFAGADRQAIRSLARVARGEGKEAIAAQGRLLQTLRDAAKQPVDEGEE